MTLRRGAFPNLRHRLGALSKSAILPLYDFIYPPVCLTCEAMLTPGEEKICARCWGGIPQVGPEHPVWSELCGQLRSEGAVGDILSCFLFEKEGALQQVLHLMKYGGMRSLGERLGEEVGRRMILNGHFLTHDALVPVPLHKLKQRERGYNQAEHICRGIYSKTRIPVSTSLLLRKRHTESQTELDRESRKRNVSGAFVLNPKCGGEVEGRSFILVDDVITTGSTVGACARVLLDHGAEQVLAVSAALAA
ncbi:MAG TPA: ComF family protein [Bacteroidota bacterium]